MTTSMVIDMNLGDNSGTKSTVAVAHGGSGNGHGRRKTKGGNEASQKKNKQPQRGMGVEQLERLRLQERWKKMTELSSLPLAPVPQFSPFVPQQLNGVTNGGGVQFRQAVYFNGVNYPMNTIQNATTSELSSIQNYNYVNCLSDGCGVCYKKKRTNGGSGTCSVNPYRNNNAVMEMIEAGRPRHSSGQENEVMSVHRHGMTEYEFFPGKSGGGATEMTSAWCGSGVVAGGSVGIGGEGMLGLRGGEDSCVTAHHHGFNGNEVGNVSSLDLSLKLSY